MSVFVPFRALGLISDDVPFATQKRGKEIFITVSVGKCWQIYNASNLRIRLIGPDLQRTITALACKRDLTFAAVGRTIVETQRVHKTGIYRGHVGRIFQLMVLGDYLLSLSEDRTVRVWEIGSYDDPLSIIQLEDDFVPTCMAHPDTYLNKIVVGARDGRIHLWNFNSNSKVYEFASFGSSICCIVPSPALDIVGIGLSDGRAVLQHLRTDDALLELKNAAGAGAKAEQFLAGSVDEISSRGTQSSCTCISFRTGEGTPLMATGGTAGVISIWNLDSQTLHAIIREAHDNRLCAFEFLAGQPILVSTGYDNSIKEWIFDGPDSQPRLLRFRSGHSAPPTIVRHYSDSSRLLSGGQDRAFRYFSIVQDAQSRELSQGNTKRRAKRLKINEDELKLARIISLDACDVRERDWSNVITAHEQDIKAYVWRLQKFAQGEYALVPPVKDHTMLAPVSTVCLSRCGNFGFVGASNGRIDRYNMQSGLHRGYYTSNINDRLAHTGAVTGLAADGCNRYLVSGGLDGLLKVWNLKSRNLIRELPLGTKVSKLTFHPSICLVAVACDDLSIRVCDIESGSIVRRFKGHVDRITDLQFSQDCRWLLTSSMDSTFRIWDVPGSCILQILKMEYAVTSFSLSPTMELLVTTHVEQKGLSTWANQAFFGSSDTIIASTRPIPAQLPTVSLERFRRSKKSNISSSEKDHQQMLLHSGRNEEEKSSESSEDYEGSESLLSEREISASDTESMEDYDDVPEAAPAISERDQNIVSGNAPVAPEMITLSMLPRSQWINLVHIDTIKSRNKPIEPPKKPEAAPFFLPTVSGANAGRNPVFAPSDEIENDDDKIRKEAEAAWGAGDDDTDQSEDKNESRLLRSAAMVDLKRQQMDSLAQALSQYKQSKNWKPLLEMLKASKPNKIDIWLRQMEILDDSFGDHELLLLFLSFLEHAIASDTEFQFLQALLRATILIHGESISQYPSLQEAARRVEDKTHQAWSRISNMLDHVQCLVGILGSMHA